MKEPRSVLRRVAAEQNCQCIAGNHPHGDAAPCGQPPVAEAWTPFGTFRICADCEKALMPVMAALVGSGQ